MASTVQQDDNAHKVTKASRPSDSTQTFHVGTRRSILARVQADEVVKALREAWPEHNFEIHAMSTTGDNNQKTALHKFNEKALWTQELEVLLQSKELDLIVHSLKDMPTQLPHDLELGCVTKREDPRDALVLHPSLVGKVKSLKDLPEGAVVGTSSLRRTAQLKRHYPQLQFKDVRGNIGTRLGKLDAADSEYSAICIAVAGLERLGMGGRINTFLSKDHGGMLHAVGQGALGIEIRKDDKRTADLLSRIGCDRTHRQALTERSLMRTLEGGCSVPIGVETEWVAKKRFHDTHVGVGIKPAEDYHQASGTAVPGGDTSTKEQEDEKTDELIMRAIVVSLDGQEAAEIETRRLITNHAQAEELGFDAAKLLVQQGADKILEQVQLNRGIIQEQGNA
ncbi:Porphobilinogen deaminase [Fulvia fulva]|uniref:Porphobilinogen deaminase n=1 Tax=Passalora fulva TaxID=5499 RepID=A0A9Q8P5X7_PASFU|nr:Porphobilinogen deaminase [Fulvia fulva]KAK4631331.1 Porphobilinogen deaminase [Fulvia fulva]KAK4633511.1 Porphobilinogen deaminase [Fulvia fulva]UJO14458.1 Porphobilinogen deaminase [Fulvia fulva]WPV11073.1 Porphobilinogen deaminase [Fulvia fulva]WPV26484.1 Porphobilinogen deaminase [Fulvia fulva]